LFLNIKIKPAADLSRLEEVLVLVEKQERQPVAEDNVRVRAADILAQRLPSVPDKPAVDPNAPPSAVPGAAKPGSAPGAGTTGVTAQKTSPTTGTTGVLTQKTPTGGALATKPATGAATQQGINRGTTPVPLRPPVTSTTTTAPVTTPKPKILEDPLAPKPEGAQPEPPIIEQKPATPPTVPPNSQPPNEDNSPQ